LWSGTEKKPTYPPAQRGGDSPTPVGRRAERNKKNANFLFAFFLRYNGVHAVPPFLRYIGARFAHPHLRITTSGAKSAHGYDNETSIAKYRHVKIKRYRR